MDQSPGSIKVLAINASPRIGGNTDIAVDTAIEGAVKKGARADKIILNVLQFKPCQECDEPKPDGACRFEDDMDMVYQKFKEAGAVILVSPIFFGSVSAQAKMMIDRFQCAWKSKYILKKDLFPEKKIGAFIAVAASEKSDFFQNAKAIVRNLFTTLNIEYIGELFFPGLEGKGAILKHRDFMQRAYKLGGDITDMVKRQKGGR
jgi:multimeric flavodoxin WrbA